MNVSDLKQDGYVKVAYPQALRSAVTGAMQSWQNFCELPMAEKEKFAAHDSKHDFGYMPGAVDSKELFHVSKAEVPWLLKAATSAGDERGAGFIAAIDELITQVTPLVGDFASSVEKEYNLEGFADEVTRFVDNWVFRYLHYYGGSTMLAKAHPDRGGFTLHLDESAPGGEYLRQDKEWKSWPVSHDETIIFPGVVLQHRSQGALKALWHRVQPTDVTSEKGRFAMVAFIDFDHPYRIDAAKYPHLSDLAEGFNLDMPFEEYEEMFELVS